MATAYGNDLKGQAPLTFHAIVGAVAFVNRWISVASHVAVTTMWLVPDRRLEKVTPAHVGPATSST